MSAPAPAVPGAPAPADSVAGGPASGERRRHASMAIALGVPVFVAMVLTLFLWPSLRAAPKGLDLAVVGTSTVVENVTQALNRAKPGAFDLVAVPDVDAARRAVRDRDVAGALVPGKPVRVLTAGAGGPVVVQTVQGAARGLAAGRPRPSWRTWCRHQPATPGASSSAAACSR